MEQKINPLWPQLRPKARCKIQDFCLYFQVDEYLINV
jgi:hypothetical protein